MFIKTSVYNYSKLLQAIERAHSSRKDESIE